MVSNPKWTPDFVPAFPTGMDSGKDPDLIPQTSAARLRNVSLRGGRPKSRPRFVKRHDLPVGKIQGAAVFSERGVLLVSLDGRVYEVNPNSWGRVEKTSDSDRNNPNRPRHYFCETVGSMVIQDDQSEPIIYDGDQFRRAKEDEVPVGAMMAYSNGRLSVAVANRRSVRIGDIRQEEHQSELKFTETYSLLGGGDFAFPSRVTALASLPVIDTASGQGSLCVGCREGFSSLKTQITSRDIWPDVSFATEVFPDVGVVGHRAVAGVNQDLFFIAKDGLRTFRATVSDYESYGLVPISREMAHRTDFNEESFLEDSAVVLFDNRVLFTHSPAKYGNRFINLGLGSLNLDSLARSGQKSPPVFDGEWDGLAIAELVAGEISGQRRCFIVGRDAAGNNAIWEVLPERADRTDGDSPTQEVVTGQLVGAGKNAFKTLRRCDAVFSNIRENLTVQFFFRPDNYPYWVKWDELSVAAPAPGGWGSVQPGYLPLSTRSVPERFNEQVQKFLHHGHGFQIKVVWTGRAKIELIQLFTEVIPQPSVSINVEGGSPILSNSVPEGQQVESFWFPFSASPHP